MFWRAVFLFGLLAILIGILILLPAYVFNQVSAWQIWSASLLYFIFFAGAAWRGIKHGKLAKDKDDRQLKTTSGRVAAVVRSLGLLAAHVLAVYEFSQQEPLAWLSLIGIGLMVVGLMVNRMAISALGKFWDKLVIKEDHRLITEGIYAYIRHPIYTSYILLFMGYVVLFHAPISAMLFAAVLSVWYGSRISLEEAMLIEKFGDAYREYRTHTKRLFPFLY
ncbi:MAG: isoprenylcysteine carboxylmethyltransferase family protein [Chloroherpetonaceae bacterium]